MPPLIVIAVTYTVLSYITVKSLRTGATSIYGGGLNAKVTKSEITTEPSKTEKYSQDEDRYLATTIYGGSNILGTISGSSLIDISGGQLGTISETEGFDYTSKDVLLLKNIEFISNDDFWL